MTRSIKSLFAATALLLALPAILRAEPLKGVGYTVPAGWQEGDEGAAKVLMPGKLNDNEIVAMVLTPAVPATEATPNQQFDGVVASANADVKLL